MRLQVLLQLQQAVQTFGRCVAGSMPLQYREIRSRSWLSTPTHAVNAEGEYSQRLYCTNTQQLPAAQISVLSLTLLLLRELTPLFIRNRVCTAQGAAPCYTSTFSGHFVRYDRSILPPRSPSPARLVRDSVSDSRREAEYLCGLWLRPSVLRSLPLAVKSALGDVRRAARPMSPLPPHTPRTALPAHCGTYLYVTLTVSSRRRTR